MAAAGLFSAFFALLATGSLTYALAEGIFPIIVFWYLNQPDIKKAFAIPTES
jgi:ABC-type Co2+ transport system permease subunit